MKRMISAALGFFAFFELLNFCYGATYQPKNLGYVNFSYSSMTITAINLTTAPTMGYPVWCYNCTANGGAGTVCVSTGATDVFQWILSTGTRCK